MSARIGLFGGSFNPIHIGHLITARSIAEHLDLSQVLFIPCSRPPHKWPHELVGMRHRLKMAALAIDGEPGFGVSDVEQREDKLHYPIYAIDTLRRELGPNTDLYWIIGADMVHELRHWHRLAEMMHMCHIVISTRAGVQMPSFDLLSEVISDEQIQSLHRGMVTTPACQISATQIRQRVHERQSIRYLAPESVCDYIEECGLYLPDSQ